MTGVSQHADDFCNRPNRDGLSSRLISSLTKVRTGFPLTAHGSRRMIWSIVPIKAV
jgi:hypothetical protein